MSDVQEMRVVELLDSAFLGKSLPLTWVEKMNLTKARHCVWFRTYEEADAYITLWASHRAQSAHEFAARNALKTVQELCQARVWYPVSLSARNRPTLSPHASKVCRSVLEHFSLSPGTPG